ncbi:MAG: hypothetical protein J6C40_16230 [Lentisphaeria bacterium]|nr:hypothetical protein [Lentisphaeria bacterium]
MYTEEEITKKIADAEKYRLSGRHLLNDRAAVKLECNGIGAAWMPDSLRKTIGALHPSLILAADIHDRRYSIGGTSSDREAADEEFKENCFRIITEKYRWYNPGRFFLKRQTLRFYNILRLFGSMAWNNAGGNHE